MCGRGRWGAGLARSAVFLVAVLIHERLTGLKDRVFLLCGPMDSADQSGQNHPQGIEGQLVDKAGYGVPGAKVYLMPGLGVKHAFKLMQEASEGRIFLPAAQTVSDETGKFMMGIERVEDGKVYEVRVVHDKFCDHKLPNIQFLEQDWVNVGRISLQRGVIVEGKVTVKGTNYPIAEATVSIGNANGTIDIAPVPGRENGITAAVNASGFYRIENVDPVGICMMVLAVWFIVRGRRALGFAALGVCFLAKYIAVVFAPFFLFRRRFTLVSLAAVGVVLLGPFPYTAALDFVRCWDG